MIRTTQDLEAYMPDRIESLMEAFHWKQEDLASEARLTQAAVSKYLNRNLKPRRIPKLPELLRICEAFCLELDEFFDYSKDYGPIAVKRATKKRRKK